MDSSVQSPVQRAEGRMLDAAIHRLRFPSEVLSLSCGLLQSWRHVTQARGNPGPDPRPSHLTPTVRSPLGAQTTASPYRHADVTIASRFAVTGPGGASGASCRDVVFRHEMQLRYTGQPGGQKQRQLAPRFHVLLLCHRTGRAGGLLLYGGSD